MKDINKAMAIYNHIVIMCQASIGAALSLYLIILLIPTMTITSCNIFFAYSVQCLRCYKRLYGLCRDVIDNSKGQFFKYHTV